MKLTSFFRLRGANTLTAGAILVGDANNEPQAVAPTGDVTITNAGVTAIGSGKVLAAMLANTAVTPASYTNTNLTVDAQGRITAASNGSAGASANDYISGLLVTQSSTTVIAISAGSAYVTSSVITYAGGTNTPTLAASKMYSVYLNGDGSIEVNQEDPPTTTYQGSARRRASGNLGRFIGSFITDASAHIIQQAFSSGGNRADVTYQADTTAAPFRVLTAGVSATMAAVSLLGVVPRYASPQAALVVYAGVSSGAPRSVAVGISSDGGATTHETMGVDGYIATAGASFPRANGLTHIDASTPQLWYFVSGGSPGSCYVDVVGYVLLR